MRALSSALLLLLFTCSGRFTGAAPSLTPVSDNNWGLKIVIFDVGQGDGTLLLTPNGQAVIIDLGETKAQGLAMADYLLSPGKNGVGSLNTIDLVFASHYDADHIGGVRGLQGKIKTKAGCDQGPSAARDPKNPRGLYTAYVKYLGDKNGNGKRDSGENEFVRHKAEPGQEFKLGQGQNVTITIVSVRGDTAGTAYDLDLVPDHRDSDENPGSLIQLIRLGAFEYLTTGDTTSDDWHSKPDPEHDPEEAMILAHALPGDQSVNILKVAHHGSDTSTGRVFVQTTRPEVAIISSDLTKDKLPKLTSLKVLEQNSATVLVTGRATDKKGKYHQSSHSFDNGYAPTNTTDKLGTITIWVSNDGSKYTVRTDKNPQFQLTRSSSRG